MKHQLVREDGIHRYEPSAAVEHLLHDHVGMARGKHVQQAAAVYGRIRRAGGCVHGRAFLLLDLCQHRIYFIQICIVRQLFCGHP